MRGFLNFLIGLVVGVLIGIGVMIFSPEFVNNLLRIDLAPTGRAVEGRVVAKELQEDRLLLTVVTPEGAVLVTFTKKVPEINLLVDRDDIIGLGLNRYRPFVNDPPVIKVKKKFPSPPGPEAETIKPLRPEPTVKPPEVMEQQPEGTGQ